MGSAVNAFLKFDVAKAVRREKFNLKEAQAALDTQVLKDSNHYIPKDTGNLEASGVRASDPGSGIVSWDTPYARNLYYNDRGAEFSTDTNPNARDHWFEAAKKQHKDDWRDVAAKAGGFK